MATNRPAATALETDRLISGREAVTAERTFLEFFAGVGLVRQGLRAGGWRCLYANDISPKKHAMYAAQFPDEDHVHVEDLWNSAAILDRIPGPATLATASFPCTDLSTAGHYRGLAGKESSAFFAFTKVLRGLADRGEQPPLVMLENVPGLLTANNGADFRVACQALAELGYWLDALLVDARHFLPQSRPRLFLIGVTADRLPAPAPRRGDDRFLREPWRERVERAPTIRPERLVAAIDATPLATDWIAHEIPPPPQCRVALETMIDCNEEQAWWGDEARDKHLAMMSESHREVVERLRSEGQRRVGTIYRRKRQGTTRAEVRFDGLAGCLRTPKGGSARQIVIVIDRGEVRLRWMNPREYARLQGAPDFPIQVPDSQAIFGFADGVCVPVIEWLDRYLLGPLAGVVRNG